MSHIGSAAIRSDAWSKVNGETVYTYDYKEVGMLYGVLLRSPHAAGRLVRCDLAKAHTMPGVRAAIAAPDVPQTLAGWSMRDTPLFARDRVRYIGEPIAAVAADSLAEAFAAAETIAFEIEPETPVLDLEAACRPESPLVHPDWKDYVPAAGSDFPRNGNVAAECSADPGGIDEIFAAAPHVIEDEFTSQRQYQAYLEPKSAVASYRGGRYTVHTGHQFPFNVRDRVAQFLDVPATDVRVIGHAIGGGFGGKLDYSVEPHAAALSKAAGGRAVKIANSRVADLITANCRESTLVRMRSAVDAEGNILARDVEAYMDNGAYTGEMSYMASFPFHCGAINYRVGKFRAKGKLVYTNTPPTGAMRGVSGPAMYAALESHMDHIAGELGFDRRAYRLQHLFGNGDALPNGQVLDNAELLQRGFDEIEKIVPWQGKAKDSTALKGRGLCAAIWLVNSLPGSLSLKLEEDGTVSVVTAATDNGSGALAAGIPQIVAETLGIRPEQVRVSDPDTDISGWEGGSQGGRTTQVVGLAAIQGAKEIRTKALKTAAGLLQVEAASLDIVDGGIRVAGETESRMALSEVAMAATFGGEPIQGTGGAALPAVPFNPGCANGLLFPFFTSPTYHVHYAEVEVNPVSGNVDVTRYVVAQDVGRVINSACARGQIQGAVAQSIGYSLYESMRFAEDGQIIESNLQFYRLPLAVDIPTVEYTVMETESDEGPFGAKGSGEAPVL
ncbi:MAG: aldehyde oxidase, partial [Rhodospirillaceae bacterium]|nr:aldehyde oxidase [Rhodospirillaceae bacterium]